MSLIKRLSYQGFRVEAERILTKLKAYIDTFISQIESAKETALTSIANLRANSINDLQDVKADVENKLEYAGEISTGDINRIWNGEEPQSDVAKEFLGKDGLAEVKGLIYAAALDQIKFISGNHADVAWGTKIVENGTPANNKVGNRTLYATYKAKIGCYWMLNNGKAIKLDPTDKTKTITGDNVDHSTLGGHIMVRIPAHYEKTCYCFEYGCNVQWCAETYFDGAKYIPDQWVGSYIAGLTGSTLVSRSGFVPSVNKTIVNFQSYAQSNGSDWGMVSYMNRKVMRDICLWEYGEANIQRNLGYGMCGSTIVANLYLTTNTVACGLSNSLGDALDVVTGTWSYNNVSGVNQCVPNLLGIEDPYGKVWEMTQGCYFGSSANIGLTDGRPSQTQYDSYIYKGNGLPTDVATVPAAEYYVLRRPNEAN